MEQVWNGIKIERSFIVSKNLKEFENRNRGWWFWKQPPSYTIKVTTVWNFNKYLQNPKRTKIVNSYFFDFTKLHKELLLK